MVNSPKVTRASVLAILRRLEVVYPTPKVALLFENPFQLLIATILSAQATDPQVNRVTPSLFARYPTPSRLAGAGRDQVEEIIYSTGFYKAKARNIIACANDIVARFGGEVPDNIEALVTLPGVGRKTANVVLGTVFGQPAIVVDTHVRRVSGRLRWSASNHPDHIEADLAKWMPKPMWTTGSHRLLLHGRHTCVARAPHCVGCPIYELCPADGEKQRAQRILASA